MAVIDEAVPPLQARQTVRINVMPEPTLRIAQIDGDRVRLIFSGAPRDCVRLGYSDALTQWLPRASGRADSAGRLEFAELPVAGQSTRWFRAISVPCADFIEPTGPLESQ